MDSGFLQDADLELLRGLLGRPFFHICAHNAEVMADSGVIQAAGVSIEQAEGVWLHLAGDWWEGSEFEDCFKLKVVQSSSMMHPSIARGATDRVVFAPQDSALAAVPVWFFNRGNLEEIEIYRGAPPCFRAGNESDTLLVFRHGGRVTFGLMPVWLPWGYLQLSFSQKLIEEWKATYTLFTTLRSSA